MEMIVADEEPFVVGTMFRGHTRNQLFGSDAFSLSLDHHRSAVRVFGAHVDAVVTLHALEAHPDVGLHGFDDVAEMQRAVGVGQRAGNEDLARHESAGPERGRKYRRGGGDTASLRERAVNPDPSQARIWPWKCPS